MDCAQSSAAPMADCAELCNAACRLRTFKHWSSSQGMDGRVTAGEPGVKWRWPGRKSPSSRIKAEAKSRPGLIQPDQGCRGGPRAPAPNEPGDLASARLGTCSSAALVAASASRYMLWRSRINKKRATAFEAKRKDPD